MKDVIAVFKVEIFLRESRNGSPVRHRSVPGDVAAMLALVFVLVSYRTFYDFALPRDFPFSVVRLATGFHSHLLGRWRGRTAG